MHVRKLVIEIAKRSIQVKTLYLSRNASIDDDAASLIGLLFFAKSSVRTLYLDETQITADGFIEILRNTYMNFKIEKLSFVNCLELRIETKE